MWATKQCFSPVASVGPFTAWDLCVPVFALRQQSDLSPLLYNNRGSHLFLLTQTLMQPERWHSESDRVWWLGLLFLGEWNVKQRQEDCRRYNSTDFSKERLIRGACSAPWIGLRCGGKIRGRHDCVAAWKCRVSETCEGSGTHARTDDSSLFASHFIQSSLPDLLDSGRRARTQTHLLTWIHFFFTVSSPPPLTSYVKTHTHTQPEDKHACACQPSRWAQSAVAVEQIDVCREWRQPLFLFLSPLPSSTVALAVTLWSRKRTHLKQWIGRWGMEMCVCVCAPPRSPFSQNCCVGACVGR